jgi:hypothetical protein
VASRDIAPGAILRRDDATVAWTLGSILAGATVVAATDVASESGQVLIYTGAGMVVIWLAHSYAAFVGHGGRFDIHGLASRLRHAMNIELPVLASAVPTLIALASASLIGAGVSSTGLVGLMAAIATMAVTAARAARRTGASPLGVSTAVGGALILGAMLIAAKVALK